MEIHATTKLAPVKLGVAFGIICGLSVALTTIAGIYGLLGGFTVWNGLLVDIYGMLGYGISWSGVLLGALYAFIDGFIFFALGGWLYNMFIK